MKFVKSNLYIINVKEKMKYIHFNQCYVVSIKIIQTKISLSFLFTGFFFIN